MVSSGVLHLSLVKCVCVLFLFIQCTVLSVTIYLHRGEAHQSISLNPFMRHLFRFWLWLTTGIIPEEWVSVHLKHHQLSDQEGDPHSPQLLGLQKVLWQGTELYRQSRKAALEQHTTVSSHIEPKLYRRYPRLGLVIMFFLDVFLFGYIGVTFWAIQMLWIPLWMNGVVNGFGHYFGYRHFATTEHSRNLSPLALWIGGEELHHNHHAYPSSAKFSIYWWECDLGYGVIRILSWLKLAKIHPYGSE